MVYGIDVQLDQVDPQQDWKQRWEKAWDDVDKSRQALLEKLNEVALPIPMKPPKEDKKMRRALRRRT